MMTYERRHFIAAAAAGALVPALGQAPARAAAPAVGRQVPGFYRFKVGAFEVTVLNDGQTNFEVNAQRFPNTPPEEVLRFMDAHFIPARPGLSPFNTTVVNTGRNLVLIDAGFANNGAPTTGRMAENMRAAGIDPTQIDTILLTHFHPDHINGLRSREGALVYPNAEIIAHPAEIDHWMDDARMTAMPEAARGVFTVARRVFSPILGSVKRGAWGQEWVPGITAVQSNGHTPGHTCFIVASENARLMVIGDALNDPRIFARNVGWHLGFDMDRDGAVAMRRRLLDMLAAERMPAVFYHGAFPGTGFIAKAGDNYDWFPITFSATV